MKKVKVVIPLYREMLPEFELKALCNTLKVLDRYDMTFVVPESLCLDGLRSQFDIDKYQVIGVTSQWLGRENGIQGYNNMMMSKDFYMLFSDVDYILICHTDAYIFRDELDYWCDQNYDYAAAPWPKPSMYNVPLIRHYMQFRNKVFRFNGSLLRQDLFNRVGNGGLSLRNVSNFILACDKYEEEIKLFCSKKHHLYSEDVFWATVPKEFNYPTLEEVFKFSFDVKPELCYKLSGNRLPFGCHGITQERIYKFWKNIIQL